MERTLSEEEADELAKNKLCLVYTLTKSGNCTKLHFDQVLPSDNLNFLIHTVKLGNKERFDKEKIGNKEPFPVTNLPSTS